MRQATECWNGGLTIGGRKLCNLRSADDTVLLLASSERELTTLLKRVKYFSRTVNLIY